MKSLVRAAMIGALLSTSALAVQAQAQPPAMTSSEAMFEATTFSLSAHGEARVAPDMATINFGVMTEAPSAAEAMRQNAEKMNRVVAALRSQGIAERDIQTSSLNLNAQYDYRDNATPVLRGYQAQNQVTIRVLDLQRLGSTIDAVVTAGSNQINGIGFGLVDPTVAENAARRAAVAALRAKADLYALEMETNVLRLVNLTEGGGYSAPPPMPMAMYARAESAQMDTPVQGGELSVRVDVSAIYVVAPTR